MQEIIEAERGKSAEDMVEMKLRKHSRLWWFAHILIAPTLLAVLLFLWLATGERAMPMLTPFVESELNRQIAPARVTIKDVFVHMDAPKGTLVAEVKGVTVVNDKQVKLVYLPAVKMRLATRYLLMGRIKLREVGIVNPVITAHRHEDGGLRFSFASEEVSTPVKAYDGQAVPTTSELQFSQLFGALQQLGLRNVSLLQGKIRVVDGERELALHAPAILLDLRRVAGQDAEIALDAVLQVHAHKARVQALLSLFGKDKDVHVRAKLQEFPLTFLAPFHAKLAAVANSDMVLSADLQADISSQTHLKKAVIHVNKASGWVKDPTLFPEGFRVDDLRAHIDVAEDAQTVTLSKLYVKTMRGAFFEGKALAARVERGTEDASAPEFEDCFWDECADAFAVPSSRVSGYDIAAQLQAYRVYLDDLKYHWPVVLAPMSRAWVLQNIAQGMVMRAELNVHITPEMLEQRPLPPEFLDAALQVEGAQVRYLPKMPVIEALDGTVYFTGNSMRVEATSGKTLAATTLKKAEVTIPDFFDLKHGIPLVVDASLVSNGKDIATAMDAEHLKLGQSIQLRPEALQGEADGRIQLELPLYSSAIEGNTKPYDELVLYQVDAKIANVTQDKIQGKWDIKGLNGSFQAKNGEVTLDGKAALNTVPLTLKVHNIRSEQTVQGTVQNVYETQYTVDGAMTPEALKLLGAGSLPLVTGTLGVKADIVEADNKPTVTKGVIDLKQSDVSIPVLAWHKPVGVEASVSFTHHADAGFDLLRDLELKASGLFLQGEVDVAKKDSEVKRLVLPQFRYGRSDLSVDYRVNADNSAEKLVLRGAVADARPWMEEEVEAGKALTEAQKKAQAAPVENPFDKLEHMDIDVDVARLETGTDRMLEKVVARLSCQKTCSKVDIRAQTKANKPFTFAIYPEKGVRVLHAQTQDAGEVLRVLGASQHVHDGSFSLQGSWNDGFSSPVFSGGFIMKDFTVTDAPVLTRLLSLMSLSGLANALSGQGIGFTKLSMDAEYADGVLRIREGKAHGSAVGMTAKGTLAPFDKKVDVEGTLVPAYAANSILGNIPVLGTLLTGGEGGGIIAANFSIKGNTADPSVSVNPLSLLTPGFLRKLFDITK